MFNRDLQLRVQYLEDSNKELRERWFRCEDQIALLARNAGVEFNIQPRKLVLDKILETKYTQ